MAVERDSTQLDYPPSNPDLARAHGCSLDCPTTRLQVSWEQQDKEERERQGLEHSGNGFPRMEKALSPPRMPACLCFSCCEVVIVVSPSTAQRIGLEFTNNRARTRTLYQLGGINRIRHMLIPGR